MARALQLPRERFDCGGVCHGTMTSWFNATFPGAAVTVEYGARPSRRTLRREAPRQLLRLFGAFHGTADWVDPHPGLPPQPMDQASQEACRRLFAGCTLVPA